MYSIQFLIYFYRRISRCCNIQLSNCHLNPKLQIQDRFHLLQIHRLVTNSSDNFTNLFHEFFPRIFLSLSSWKRKQTSHWFKTSVFSQFASWKRNPNKYSLKKFVDSEFEIGESIWWTTPSVAHKSTVSSRSAKIVA